MTDKTDGLLFVKMQNGTVTMSLSTTTLIILWSFIILTFVYLILFNVFYYKWNEMKTISKNTNNTKWENRFSKYYDGDESESDETEDDETDQYSDDFTDYDDTDETLSDLL